MLTKLGHDIMAKAAAFGSRALAASAERLGLVRPTDPLSLHRSMTPQANMERSIALHPWEGPVTRRGAARTFGARMRAMNEGSPNWWTA